jgi:hypothetical protein
MWPRVELTYTAGGLWVLTGPHGPLWYASVLSKLSAVYRLANDESRMGRCGTPVF